MIILNFISGILVGSIEIALATILLILIAFAYKTLPNYLNKEIKKHDNNKSVEERKNMMISALEKAEKQVRKSRREFDKLDPELCDLFDYQVNCKNSYERIKSDLNQLIFTIKESKKEKIKL